MKEIQDVPAGRAANHRAFGYFLVEIVASMAEISQSLDDPAVGAASQRKSSFLTLCIHCFCRYRGPEGFGRAGGKHQRRVGLLSATSTQYYILRCITECPWRSAG